MNPPRHDFLAGAVLTRDENVGIGRGYPVHEFEDRLHGARFGDQSGHAVASEHAVLEL